MPYQPPCNALKLPGTPYNPFVTPLKPHGTPYQQCESPLTIMQVHVLLHNNHLMFLHYKMYILPMNGPVQCPDPDCGSGFVFSPRASFFSECRKPWFGLSHSGMGTTNEQQWTPHWIHTKIPTR